MLFTVITINYNNASGLQKTLLSVEQQSFKDFEHIIIDGGSTDGSVEVIQDYAKQNVRWVSEADNGVYDAMNKGIGMSKGSHLIFMNSGDCFSAPQSLDLMSAFCNEYDIIYGDLVDVSRNPPQRFSYAPVTPQFMLSSGIPHQSAAIRRQLFKTVGLYDPSYKIVADWAFYMLAFFKEKAKSIYIPEVLCEFEGGGISSQSDNLIRIVQEYLRFLKKNFPEHVKSFLQSNVMFRKYLRSKPRWNRWYHYLRFKLL